MEVWDRFERRPQYKLAFAGALVILLGAEGGLALGGPGVPSTSAAIAKGIHLFVILLASIAVLFRAATRTRRRGAWAMIGAAFALWFAGDAFHVLFEPVGSSPSPSVRDAFYLSAYVLGILGIRQLGGRVKGQPLISVGVLVSLLGLATIWSGLTFGEVLPSGPGSNEATVARALPFFNVVLMGTAIIGLSARGWRLNRVFALLCLGIALIAVAGLTYGAQVANGTYAESPILDLLWSAGASMILSAAWTRADRTPAGVEGDVLVPAIAIAGIGGATGVLMWDHFSNLDTATVCLAGATLLAGVGLLIRMQRDRVVAQNRAHATESLRSASIEAALDGIISTDGDGKIQEWNAAASRIFGYQAKDVLGMDMADLIIPPDRREAYRRDLERSLQGRSGLLLDQRIEVTAMRASGAHFPAELAVTQIQTDPPVFTGFLRDIEQQKRRQEESERLAMIVRSAEDAILSKDLHGNVTAWNKGAERLYGYTPGEAIGRPLASLIVPREAKFQAEFERISAALFAGESVSLETKRERKDGAIVEVSLRGFPARNASGEIVGASTIAHDITEQRLHARREEKDRDGKEWQGRIRTALDTNEFVFWGQPVVDLNTHVIDHYELLVRMETGGRLVNPSEFIPHAERSGLIREIDMWAVRTGLEFAQSVPVAINLSAKSFCNRELFELIRFSLAYSPTPAENLIFEITETAAAEDLDGARRLVEDLTELGCGVALDDFGTGFGSFTYLQNLPLTELKIDMEFIQALTEDPIDQRLVSSIVSVANRFGMKTVAEGVEDEVTLQILRRLNVDLVQGYHVGYPGRMSTFGVGATSAAPISDAEPQLQGIQGETL